MEGTSDLVLRSADSENMDLLYDKNSLECGELSSTKEIISTYGKIRVRSD